VFNAAVLTLIQSIRLERPAVAFNPPEAVTSILHTFLYTKVKLSFYL